MHKKSFLNNFLHQFKLGFSKTPKRKHKVKSNRLKEGDKAYIPKVVKLRVNEPYQVSDIRYKFTTISNHINP